MITYAFIFEIQIVRAHTTHDTAAAWYHSGTHWSTMVRYQSTLASKYGGLAVAY